MPNLRTRQNRYEAYQELLRSQDEERRAARRANEIRDVALGSSLSADQLRQVQSQLPGHAAEISVFMAEEKVFVFLMTSNGLEYVVTELASSSAERTIRQLQLALTNPYTDFYVEPAVSLYRQLFEPLVPRLSEKITELVYSPDGLFSRIPLGVLRDGDHFLAEKYAIRRFPQARSPLR